MIPTQLLLLTTLLLAPFILSTHIPPHHRSHPRSPPPHNTTLTRRAFSGTATYFVTGLGACGQFNVPSDFIVALNAPQYYANSECFKSITITADNGHTLGASVVDLCPGCGYGSLDLSQGLFEAFGYSSAGGGTFGITWDWADAVKTTSTSTSQEPTSTTPTSTYTPPTSTSTSTTPTPTTTTHSSTTLSPTTTTTSSTSSFGTSTSTSTSSLSSPDLAPDPAAVTPTSNLETLTGVVLGLGGMVVAGAGGGGGE